MNDYFLEGVQLEQLAQGESFYLKVTVDFDLTDYTAKMQMRQNAAATAALLSLDTADSSIIITPGASSSTIEIFADAEDTALLPVLTAVWDLFLYKAGVATRLLYGTQPIVAGVTR